MMQEMYEKIEAAVIWGTVILAISMVLYLAFLQFLKLKRRRARHRHRTRRARTQPTGFAGEHRPSQNQQSRSI
jgi:hypothetical protein